MRFNTILTILRKDLRDAIRDSRVLIAILVPLGVGVLYFAVFPETTPRPTATLVYVTADASSLPATMCSALSGTVDLSLRQVRDAAEARSLVSAESADVGLIIPAGFDAAVQRGETPPLTVIRPESPGSGASITLAALDQSLRLMAGQRTPAMVQIEVAPSQQTGIVAVMEQVGLRQYFVLSAVVMLIGMITMLAVPIVLAEEREKKTLEALVMVASYPEVVSAKALLGVVYAAIAIPLLLGITRVLPGNALSFIATFGLLSVGLIGFGLLLGSLFTANQLNTWGSLFLLPLILPAFLVGIPLPGIVEQIFLLLPSTHAMRLALNSLSATSIYPNPWLSYVVIILWGVLAYGLLLWRLSRREA